MAKTKHSAALPPLTSHHLTPDERDALAGRLGIHGGALVRDNLADIIQDIEATALDKTAETDSNVKITTAVTVNYDAKTRRVVIDAKMDWKREVKHSDSSEPDCIDFNQMNLPGVEE